LKEKAKSFLYHSLAMDESNDVSDVAQHMIFIITGIGDKCCLYEQQTSVSNLRDTTGGD
jgi:hypothetical protein